MPAPRVLPAADISEDITAIRVTKDTFTPEGESRSIEYNKLELEFSNEEVLTFKLEPVDKTIIRLSTNIITAK